MWKCKRCWSSDIFCDIEGVFTGVGRPIKYGIFKEIEEIKIEDTSIARVHCNNCGDESEKLEDLAFWEED